MQLNLILNQLGLYSFQPRIKFDKEPDFLAIANNITESYHLYEPKINSIYQLHIRNIVVKLLNFIDNFNEPINLHNELNCNFYKYEITNPFISTLLSYYKKLKIFINIDNNINDTMAINTPEYNFEYNEDVCTNDIISIIIFLNNNILSNKKELTKYLYDCIVHEMRHILEINYSKNFSDKAGATNQLINYYKNKFKNINNNDKKNLLKGKVNSLEVLYWFLSTCTYLISDHEMAAHIENIIHEIKYNNYQNLNNKKPIKRLLVKLSNIYNDYNTLLLMINKLLFDNNLNNYVTELKIFSQNYLNALNKPNMSFNKILKYWKYKLTKFLKTVENTVINYFIDNYKFDFNSEYAKD